MKKVAFLTLFSIIQLNLVSQDIFRVACNGHLTRLDSLLIDEDINMQDDRERSLLHWAVACSQQEVASYLIGKGIRLDLVDDQDKTAMHMAVRFNKLEMLGLLYQAQKNK